MGVSGPPTCHREPLLVSAGGRGRGEVERVVDADSDTCPLAAADDALEVAAAVSVCPEDAV